MTSSRDLDRLQVENARLVALLERHGIEWRQEADAPEPGLALTTAAKVALFRRLFRGRNDVFPLRWESQTGRSGYAPACANEWRPGVCEKPRIKCADCGQRDLTPVSDGVVFDHLAGRHTMGVYPLLPDDSCHFVAADFDDADWRDDVRAFARTCRAFDVSVAVEISRSGQGAHAWIFFDGPVPARDARRLATALISQTCARERQLKLSSYDRLFPSQDTMPKGGFGNLIALPLQKLARERGRSVFVDDELRPHADQWAYLHALRPMAVHDAEPAILRASDGSHPLDVGFFDDDEALEPWSAGKALLGRLSGSMPERVSITLANLAYLEKAQLPNALANRLIRLAAFQNPEFYRAQVMRMPVWDKPRVIGCAENFPRHIALPRGCVDAAVALLSENGIGIDWRDERHPGTPVVARFAGTLRPEQQAAVDAMLAHDSGVLCAPTAFGKTVVAAALIAARGVNTLVLVHRVELLKQWRERLQTFLDEDAKAIGAIGGGKPAPTGVIDIAVMQSLVRKGEVDRVVENYGHVIVDECHHLSAVSFEAILKRMKARYVLGLTATPVRRDGQHPVIFMQCGPLRFSAPKSQTMPSTLEVQPRFLDAPIDAAADAPIQQIFNALASDAHRTAVIADQVVDACENGAKVLVLTERTEHVADVERALAPYIENLVTLHGRLSAQQRNAAAARLAALPGDAPRVLLATGKLVGEGFDHAPLDTLVLAMPISWKGTLQQYAGRLHREHAGKTSARIIDFVDTGHPALARMWSRRQAGYKAMGYRVVADGVDLFSTGAA
ncbi:MAG: DEAD/DEAH box helicase family protein [Rubrivivax sp.]